MSRVVRPVRPNAVSWNKEGREVMHHCSISMKSHVSLCAVYMGSVSHTLRLKMLELTIQKSQMWFRKVNLWEICFTRATTDIARLNVVGTVVMYVIDR